jgi:hypothetical protein
MWTLQDVRRFRNKIRWDLTPEAVARAKATALESRSGNDTADQGVDGYVFSIEVWGCKVSLVLVENQRGREVCYPVQTGIPDNLLEEAVFKAGGALIVSGRYPIDDKIEAWIREKLNGEAQ